MKYDLHSCLKKGILILAGALVLLLPSIGMGQQNPNGTSAAKAFAAITSSDQAHTCFTADLTQLPAFFERAFFIQLVFADPKMVINNSNISGTSIEIFSSREYDPKPVLEMLEIYRNKALEAQKTLSADQKKELVNKYEKYR